MQIPPQYAEMIKKVLQLSQQGKLDWAVEPDGQGFFVAFRRHTLVLWEYTSPHEDDEGISVGLRDSSGKLADVFSISEGTREYVDIKSLFDLARRKAKNIDSALAEIQEELEELG